MKERLDVAVIGAGAVGQVLAGHLTEKGHAAVLVARPGQLATLRRDGVRLAKEGGRERAVAVAVTDAIPTATILDAVFVATRGDQLGAALETLRASGARSKALVLCMPVWGPDPAYAIDGFDETWILFPGFGATLLDSGAIEYAFARRPSEIGPMRGPITPALQRVAAAIAESGVAITAKPDFGYRYTALSAVGGPFAVAVAESGFDVDALVHNRPLRRTSARAARECIELIEARTGRSLGIGPRILASVASLLLLLLGPLIARRAGRGRVAFILSHRKKVADQDRALLAELHRWGVDHGRDAPALAHLLRAAPEVHISLP
jgi:ketopantoate reductase